VDLKEARQAYYDFSATASELTRKLGFAGIAIIWVFRTDDPVTGATSLSDGLLRAGVLLAISLGLDLLHYFVAGSMWGIYSRHKERLLGPRSRIRFNSPRWINWPGIVLWVLKVVVLLAAYVLLAVELGSRLN
jgi:hypothetical protein